ncbi:MULTISPECIES: hypothetical protein [Pseudanabaena]|uniref:TPR repeat-containing protein n=2 Tax=Pseudanabaena TaxID=1152 RepID=L8N3K9_9CYAN|nr:MULTISPECIES: hypothetical protein [Pseudanabaena]ELS33689.1 TPR repeat-containing protein [Pseudanabaena biceps PCC 7429]MDG3494082.1 O-linked N-acetylglucosamine transferase, SPINDLY family protein [Pseudanabaena catenata USMAC16]
MSNDISTTQAYYSLTAGDYIHAQSLYEMLISSEPQIKSHYWYLGLSLLLQGKEEEAQIAWLSGIEDDDISYHVDEIERSTEELCQVLEIEALRQESLTDYKLSWLIRQHIREINPNQINNLLKLFILSIEIGNFNIEELNDFSLIELMQLSDNQNIDRLLLLKLIAKILEIDPSNPLSFQFISQCSDYYISNSNDFINVVKPTALKIGFGLNDFTLAENMTEVCLDLQPQNLELLSHLAAFSRRNLNYTKCIDTANIYLSLATDLPNQIIATHLILEALMAAGEDWESIFTVSKSQLELLQKLIEDKPKYIDVNVISNLFNATFFQSYLTDTPQANHSIRHKINSLCQSYVNLMKQNLLNKRKKININEKLVHNNKIKVGYLSTCLRRHSIGWLSRWIFQHHDHDLFLVHAYAISPLPNETDSIQAQIAYYSDKAYSLDSNVENIINQICQDEIDILIDLDSVTGGFICEVMALKPAPIQVTWLGFDASGIPAIDYFIADPYVLPKDAQDYYSEKIWRLPNTYIAVDGFEFSIPSISREQLNIPDDAVVYLCTQTSYKRFPDTVHLQMQIINSVSNSYFLIKGWGEEEGTKRFFIDIAKKEGVSEDRLRFLPLADSEAEHRANLRIADVVLDTYPYNGATTTMETLWMCIPLVTKVGQQFSARNSYTMMMNVGVTEGISWTDEEYVEWGIRLGKDENLRKQIFWRLKESRKTSPLWDAKQFTKDIENAYQQMWSNYLAEIK